ncbi:hypothetical protein [Treponema putidum]|uniref:hypothetical protein n=1 Tax=Treponema putidum TaxID=221027 RepID=UPI003D946406
MEFDKSKVYTALNADELQIGSKCIFADSIKEIKDCLQTDFFNIETLTKIKDEAYCARFIIHNRSLHQDMDYALAYLIELPAKPKYKPFSSEKKAIEIIEQHECWIKSKMTQNCFLVGIKDSKHIPLIGYDYKEFFSLLLDGYVFADDGTPCGELVEE